MSEQPTFDRVASVYERLANFWSLGKVGQMKRSQLAYLGAEERVLYVGVGPGDDALAAAALGADVTCLDLSPKMVDGVRRRFEAEGLSGAFVVSDLFDYEPEHPFDVVAANFLFGCFSDDRRGAAVAQVAGFLRPGGRLLVADTGEPRGSVLARAFWYVYHGLAYGFSAIQGLTPWLPRFDLEQDLAAAGCSIDERRFVRLWPRGPIAFETIVAVRDG